MKKYILKMKNEIVKELPLGWFKFIPSMRYNDILQKSVDLAIRKTAKGIFEELEECKTYPYDEIDIKELIVCNADLKKIKRKWLR